MATKTIPELDSHSTLDGTELFEISQNNLSKNVDLDSLTDYFDGKISSIKNTNIELRAEPNSLVLDATGIEVFDVSYDDNDLIIDFSNDGAKNVKLNCGEEKTIELIESVWDDLRIVPGAFDFAGNADPSIVNWQPGGTGTTFKIYKFEKNDEAFFTCQMPHSYKLGTDLKPHIHWTPCERGNEESGNTVGWKFDYSIADIGEAFSSSTTIDLSDTCTGIDDYHEITQSGTINGSGITSVSAMLICRIYRTDTGADDTWVGATTAQSPGLLEVDIHFEIDTLGSRKELSKF